MTRMVLTLILTLFASFLQADVLLIEQVREVENLAVPVNGQTMSEVESAFGAPQSKAPPVGDPPITRWDYEDWSVYFEYDRVLFTVLDEGAILHTETPDS